MALAVIGDLLLPSVSSAEPKYTKIYRFQRQVQKIAPYTILESQLLSKIMSQPLA